MKISQTLYYGVGFAAGLLIVMLHTWTHYNWGKEKDLIRVKIIKYLRVSQKKEKKITKKENLPRLGNTADYDILL